MPAVTADFWALKVLSTTMGETGADDLAVDVGLGTLLTSGLTALAMAFALGAQRRSRVHTPWLYWLSVVQ